MTDISALKNKTVFITGATGLIGKAVVSRLASESGDIRIIACVRNEEKAKRIFSDFKDRIELFVSDIKDLPRKDMGVDYIIHGASITDSKSFVKRPVEVIEETVGGTKAVLDFARVNPVKSFVFLSTMEIYGTSSHDDKIYETSSNNLDSMSVRSCYPIGKRLCENMCAAYCSEYAVPTKVVRLTQTFGEGVEYGDKRVFAEFARCVIENRDIVLKTKGETERNYLYVYDAVDAILTVLQKGENGEAYNAANEETYCSIYEMARMVASKCADNKINVKIDESNVKELGYAPTLKMNLSCEKLKGLGWKAEVNLETMFARLISYMKGK